MYIKKRYHKKGGPESRNYPHTIKVGDTVEIEVSHLHTYIDGIRRFVVDKIYYKCKAWRATGLVHYEGEKYRVSKCVKYCRKIEK